MHIFPGLLIGCAGHQAINGIGRLAGLKFDGLGDQASELQRVDRFSTLLRRTNIVILLGAAKPFELYRGNRQIDAKPLAGIKPDPVHPDWPASSGRQAAGRVESQEG